MRAALEGDYERGARIAREMFERGEREEARRPAALADPRPVPRHQHALAPQRARRAGPARAALRAAGAPDRRRPAGGRRSPGRTLQAGPPGARARADRGDERRTASRRRPRDSNFVARLAQVAHVVAELGDAELAARVEPLLAPYGGLLGRARAEREHARAGRLQRRGDAAAAGPPGGGGGRRSSGRSSARGRCARGRTRRARRPGSPPRCAARGDDARAAELEAQAAATARELGMARLQRELALAAPAA